LTGPTRRRSLFAAFRAGIGDEVAATGAPVSAVTESQSEIAPVPATDSPEPETEGAQTAATVGNAEDLGAVRGPAEPAAPTPQPAGPTAKLARESAEPATGSVEPARGGVFSGTKAQIRLTPSKAPTHPASGRRGDLFVDGAGRLWFCRSGGKVASWKQVKLV
jgi:hypothetical protein